MTRPTSTWLLTQNSELRKDHIYAWTLPALWARLPGGKLVKTCPQAGICAALCYARTGTFQFSGVRRAHLEKLRMVVENLPGWERAMGAELSHPRYQKAAGIRVHDAGDFFSRDYAMAWMRLAAAHPRLFFYAYTKEVSLLKALRAEGAVPPNFTVIYSLGGREDHLVDRDRDRHAEVFADLASLEAAGYTDQSESDLLAAKLPTTRIGIVANRIPHLRRRQGTDSFGSLQATIAQRHHHRPTRPTLKEAVL